MCDPVSLTAVALTAAGTMAQAEGQSQARRAQQGAVTGEIGRQKVYRDKSLASEADTLQGVSRPEQDRLASNAEAKRGASYVAPIGGPSPTAGASGSSPYVSPLAPSNPAIAAEFQRQGTNQQSKSVAEALAKAKLDSYGDANLFTNIRTGRNAQDINFNSAEARDSNAVLPYELEAAKRKGAGMRALGDALTAAGAIVGVGGASLFGPDSGMGSWSEFGARHGISSLAGDTSYISPFAGSSGASGIFTRPLPAVSY